MKSVLMLHEDYTQKIPVMKEYTPIRALTIIKHTILDYRCKLNILLSITYE